MQPIELEFVAELIDGRCSGCRECLSHCAVRALLWVQGEEAVLIDPWACTGCGTCTTACPQEALHMRPRHGP
ncbi:MAG: 4Fe-4S dicluster domain-containing protein [Chloroflexota bacterium]